MVKRNKKVREAEEPEKQKIQRNRRARETEEPEKQKICGNRRMVVTGVRI